MPWLSVAILLVAGAVLARTPRDPEGTASDHDPEPAPTAGVGREAFAARVAAERSDLDRALRKGKVDVIDIETGEPYVRPLMRFFQDRARRQ